MSQPDRAASDGADDLVDVDGLEGTVALLHAHGYLRFSIVRHL